jgi:hypothetical protein
VSYSAQLGLAVALLANTRSATLQHALVLVIVVFYCSTLGRAWEVTGITRQGMRGRLVTGIGGGHALDLHAASARWSARRPPKFP